jgi:folate-binding protein YgfZ
MDAKAQVDAARATVLAVPLAGRETLVVTGRDRVSWLNGLLTCDLLKRPDGEGRYGLFVGRNGRVIVDAFVVVDEASIFVGVPATAVETLRQHLEHYLVMEDAEVTSRPQAYEPWALHGPRSSDVLAAARRAGGVGGGMDRTGLGGAVVFAPREHADDVRAAIEAAIGGVGGAMGDAAGWKALRLERAIPEFGVDFDETTYPQEAGLEKVAVSFDKGCYLGQEVVCMLEMRGQVRRSLAPLVVEGHDAPLQGAGVTDDTGAAAGEVTSAVLSPTLGRPVALAMLRRAFLHPDGALQIAGARARVVERPA